MNKILTMASVVVALTACSKSDNNDVPTLEQGTYPTKIITTGGTARKEQITEIKDGKVVKTTEINYRDYASNPKDFVTSETLFTYEGNDLKKRVETNLTTQKIEFESEYAYSNGKLASKKSTHLFGDETEKYNKTYTYEGNNLKKSVETYTQSSKEAVNYTESEYDYISASEIKITQTQYSITNGVQSPKTVVFLTYKLDGNGNVIEEKLETKHRIAVTTFAYDDKHNPLFQGIVRITLPDYFINPNLTKNNIVQRTHKYIPKNGNGTTEGNQWSLERVEKINYIYNDKGYPTQKKEYNFKNELTQTEDYSY